MYIFSVILYLIPLISRASYLFCLCKKLVIVFFFFFSFFTLGILKRKFCALRRWISKLPLLIDVFDKYPPTPLFFLFIFLGWKGDGIFHTFHYVQENKQGKTTWLLDVVLFMSSTKLGEWWVSVWHTLYSLFTFVKWGKYTMLFINIPWFPKTLWACSFSHIICGLYTVFVE